MEFLFPLVAINVVVFGLVAGAIWSNKGGAFGIGFLLGALLGVIGLILALVLQPSALGPYVPVAPVTSAPPAPPSAISSQSRGYPAPPPPPHANAGGYGVPPPGPGVVRECPFCKETMRRDAAVCPHCRHESPAFEYGTDGRWWSVDAAGNRVWLDEAQQRWWPEGEGPSPRDIMDLYDVIVSSPGPKPDAIAKVLADASGEGRDVFLERLAHTPATVLSQVGFATAEGVRSELARKGAVVEIRLID